ncbi:MAG TPA: hypothetical protein DCS07_09695 [Bdellovibrionales bacterium]|nr:MAG: hypothetical protein A2Z97_03655 [Bdellovibrionales bacterium GWB1_52_6]OFZ02949.1 MAG: hypothetical protein A2X97_05085 [Bdellovibrionales bacterium GWA1_52_35]HAR42884.1 hypothetical protein [Bdellovibrionales bacterium]HCM38534.1 hypothetical protein [Bdellovibrionales bacterium]
MVAVASTFEQTRWKQWLGIWFLALLVHVGFFLTQFQWTLPVSPQRVEIESIDTHRLEKIRKQWNTKKQFILNKNPTLPKADAPPPENARYESDRNQQVKTEQKARITEVVPKAGTPGAQQAPNIPKQVTEKSARQSAKRALPIPKLQNFGIPFRLSAPKAAAAVPQSTREQAADQYLNEKLPEGSENLLNTQESVYYSFYSRIYNAIGPIWQSRTREITYRRFIRPGDYSTIVDVVLDPEGELLAIRHLQDSGIPELDHAVDSSWRRVNRFPNPPTGLLNEQKELHMVWTFTVHIDEGAGIQYLPPERIDN